ncbi:MAG: response regulator [Halomonadaceae bacterium]|nr:MAG: response regulator [Halomonadaceae bacterium]
MNNTVLICDDSAMARKQMIRALPQDWGMSLATAVDGNDCLAQLRQGRGDLLFLDLNMPILDGYQVLEAIRREDLPTIVIVVSADIQPLARRRVMALGALAFVKKPLDATELVQLLNEYGFYPSEPGRKPKQGVQNPPPFQTATTLSQQSGALSWQEALQEVANIAMGQAGDHLARLLGVFVELPVPRVSEIEASELHMALADSACHDHSAAVCQGFIGGGITGEVILLFSDSSSTDMARLLGYPPQTDSQQNQEVLLDMSSILAGAFLNGISEQLSNPFSITPPDVLGHHLSIPKLLEQHSSRWQRMLAIELNYRIESHGIRCDLLLLMTGQSLPALQHKLAYLVDPL